MSDKLKMKTVIRLVVPLALLCLSTTISFSQNQPTKAASSVIYKTGKPADWPKENDAVIATPKNHKILLENEKARGLDGPVSPGETEPVNIHLCPTVFYFLTRGDFFAPAGGAKSNFALR